MTKEFYVFRHGQTENNARNIWQGAQINSGLNKTGKEQALELQQKLEPLRLEIVYTSNLRRAIQTALIAVEERVPKILNPKFKEVNFGEAEGLTYDEVETMFGELKQKVAVPKPETWHSKFPGPRSESKFEVYTRVKDELLAIGRTTRYSRIGISTHAGVLSSLLAGLNAHGIELPNCCVAHIRYDSETDNLSFIEMV